ncbi:alpha/beta fold hydrolase [Mycobacterium avium]|uniref:alpha/beta fold hydrolase n=1 Tax=Mycobacterium avium TaxID=1764 RepID=UPI00111C016C|nr:alpha/beta hydrolase [Mycobacterium avium]
MTTLRALRRPDAVPLMAANHCVNVCAATDLVRSHVPTSDGVSLSVREYGSAAASRTVVLLHGCCLDKESWCLQVEALIERWGTDIRIIAYDHRGHGDSGQAPMHTYTVQRLAADLAELLVALGVSGRVYFMGHSLGAMSILAYAALPADQRPVEPDGLVLIATAAGKLTERGLGRLLTNPVIDLLYELVRHAPRASTDAIVRAAARPIWRQLTRFGYANPTGGTAVLAKAAAGAINATPLATKIGFLRDLRGYDQSSTLPSITAQTIVLAGERDLLTPPTHGRDLAAGIAGATLVQLPGVGHMLLHEAPHVVTDAIDALLGGRRPDNSDRQRDPERSPALAGAAS